MARTKYLPETYADNHGNRLKVGQWILNQGSVWQLTEPHPGQYQIVSHSRKLTRSFTPVSGPHFGSLPWVLSKKIRLEDYPELLKRFHDRGIDAFFITSKFRPGVLLCIIKPRTHILPISLPNVSAAKKDIGLLERWLGQMIWVAEHPKKYEVLKWAADQGHANPFGNWPEITPPNELDASAKQWYNAYRDYRAQLQLEIEKEVQSLIPQAPLLPGQLPAEYRNALSDEYPLIVGEWIATIHLYGSATKSPFTEAYLWQMHEPEPGLYTAVGYGVEKTVILTPKNSAQVYPLGVRVSERLALDRYSKYMQLYREKGLAVYFYENAHRDIVLRAVVLSAPDKDTQDIVAQPSMVADMERDQALLERWLDQMMWCMLNPELGKILFWAMKNGVSFFGNWPSLMPPQGLRIVANHLSSLYEADKIRVRTPEELAAEKQEITYITELNEQTMLMSKLKLGLLDESISPSIQSLLDGTGIDKPE